LQISASISVQVDAGPETRFPPLESQSAFTLGPGHDIGFGGRFALSPEANPVYSSSKGGTTNLFQLGLGANWH
jgi:hypothetical protein